MLLGQCDQAALADLVAAYPDAPIRDLARFLVACKDNPERARARYAATLEWRATEFLEMMKLDIVTPEYAAGKLVVRGHDRKNRPLLIWNNAMHDPSACDV
eukprot:SAG22_NODE_6546_length_841_cov_0.836927_1_plen_100_part_10